MAVSQPVLRLQAVSASLSKHAHSSLLLNGSCFVITIVLEPCACVRVCVCVCVCVCVHAHAQLLSRVQFFVTWLKIFQKFLEEGGSTRCTVLETLFQDEHLVLPKFGFSNW